MLEYLTEVSTTFFYSIDDNIPLKTLAGLSTFFLECVHRKWITNRGNMKCRLPPRLPTANPLRFRFMATRLFTSLHSALSFNIITIPYCNLNAIRAPNTKTPFITID